MALLVRNLICFALAVCIVGCTSTKQYTSSNSNAEELGNKLSANVARKDIVRVHLHDTSVVEMTVIRVTHETLDGQVLGHREVLHIPLTQIAKVEKLDRKSVEGVGEVVLAIIVLVVVAALVIGMGSGYDFSGVGFEGGGKRQQ